MAGNFALGLSILMTLYLFCCAIMDMKRENKSIFSLHMILVIIMAFVFSGLAYIFI
ncbi:MULTISPECIES: hypothetical protein [Heyndrickxia]|uniref:hypothetical protein n=1 Tax=Heyndrickxia TaxID=2837504 RepID=UPI000AA1C4C2|nr:hypothetical protein [Heyndrickxia shackletonii]NEZ00581.1 hypothetical protein [Heyndrickxia shackletonii]